MQIGPHDLIPYVLGAEQVGGVARRVAALPGTRFLDVLADENLAFFRLLSAANALAFGDLGMPAWVQLDCATLPSAMIGFALPRAEVPADLWGRLAQSHAGCFPPEEGHGAQVLVGAEDLVPVSAFCAVPSTQPGTVVAFTLFSLLPGLGLGLRTKAMGLLVLRAQRQIGVTRRDGPVRRLHERIGPLRVLRDRPAAHPDAENSMVYELEVPAPAVLQDLVLGGQVVLGDEVPREGGRLRGNP